MYNFLDDKLKPVVKCDKPTTDGYEATNLISPDALQRSKGFLVYNPIRPPVDVDFELLCPINVHYVVVSAQVSTQRSSGLEIYARTSKTSYQLIAQSYFNEPGIVFYNGRIYSNGSLPDMNASYAVRFFKSSQFRTFTSSQMIRVRITKTTNSVPCLGRVEIWGNVSKTCSQTTTDTVHRLMNRQKTTPLPPNENRPTTNAPIKLKSNLEIPEEFIDPITCDIMSVPITLPSGKTIDQLTLEKCKNSELMWGRGPSDPFTGQLLTESRRPVFNAALKQRIDMFLIENADNPETHYLPRTVGQKRTICNEKYSSTNDVKRGKTDETVSSDPQLDEALRKVITDYNVTRYSILEKETVNTDKQCSDCSSKSILYVLPCKDYICRNCLLKTKAGKCKSCNADYVSSDPVKYNS